MSENSIKGRISEELRMAKETGRITSEKICEIVKEAVSDVMAEGKGGAQEIRPIVKEAMSAAVEGLRAAEIDAAENVRAAVEGVVEGVRSHTEQNVNIVRKKICELETELETEKAQLAQSVRDGLEGAKDAGETFSEDIRTQIEAISTDIKLNSAELLGLTRESVKEAVKQAIKTGKNVEEIVTHITRDATEKALKEGRFRANRLKEIVEKVLSGAVEAAEESGKEVKEVAYGAFEGVQKGVGSAMESIGNKTRAFIHDDLARTKEDLETIDELFLETVDRVAKRSGETAKEVLTGLVEQAEKTTVGLRKKIGYALETLRTAGKDTAKTTTEAAGKVTRVMAEEAMEIGKRSAEVAKGAISGMWKGAKDALQKRNENQ
jgi:ElaB/YqjD/DUF883 family membrane-anchored ribosome-binding protein